MRLILSLCLVITLFFPVSTNAMTDFSGTWLRDADKSDPMATGIGGKVVPVSANIVVKQVGDNLQIESQWDNKAATTTNYVLNGRENYTADEHGKLVAYTASWEGDKLIIDKSVRADTPFGRTERKERAEWFLSDDGNTLTVVSTSGDSLSSIRKQVYQRHQ
jgi:hypothetical protein